MLRDAEHINCYAGWTPDGLVTLTSIADDEDLDSLVLNFEPGAAHKLAIMLITAAEEAWAIRQEMEQELSG